MNGDRTLEGWGGEKRRVVVSSHSCTGKKMETAEHCDISWPTSGKEVEEEKTLRRSEEEEEEKKEEERNGPFLCKVKQIGPKERKEEKVSFLYSPPDGTSQN